MNDKILTLGEVIRTLRRRAALSQSALAKLVGVHFSSISRWERGRETEEMSIKHLRRICEATKTSPAEMITMAKALDDA